MYLWGCASTALSEFCQQKIPYTVSRKRNFYFDIHSQQNFSVLTAVFAHTCICARFGMFTMIISPFYMHSKGEAETPMRQNIPEKVGKIIYHGTKYTCSFLCVSVCRHFTFSIFTSKMIMFVYLLYF